MRDMGSAVEWDNERDLKIRAAQEINARHRAYLGAMEKWAKLIILARHQGEYLQLMEELQSH
jgi:hypothetical protein